jgi:S-adenosylmethionine:tRNA ribosyltransferase-isomerase
VGVGTFRPISSKKVEEHSMHAEKIIVSQQNVKNIIDSEFTIAVGTTSLRTLESLYWYGVKLIESAKANFFIPKEYPYHPELDLPTPKESLNEVLSYMINNNKKVLHGVTQIFIVPGYIFRIVDGLVTNYHMPESTLILLVAAFIGNNWKKLYVEAIKEEYQFLSYGDASLLIKA